MQRDEAKHILELCRPGIDDDRNDPLIAEALALLDTDPELKAWFDEQQALDARIAGVYDAIEPPADLKASILAGMRAHALRSQADASSRIGDLYPDEDDAVDFPTRQEPFATSALREPQGLEPAETASRVPTGGSTSFGWWRRYGVGAAAAVVLLFVLFAIPRDHSQAPLAPSNGAALQAGVPDMIQFLARELGNQGSRGGFDMASNEPETLQAYLNNVGSPSPSKLPRALKGNASLGCATFEYNGTQMSMICFQYDQVVHLITIRKSDCPRSFQPEEPTVYEVGNQAFKAWTDGEHVYILSTKGCKETLPQVI